MSCWFGFESVAPRRSSYLSTELTEKATRVNARLKIMASMLWFLTMCRGFRSRHENLHNDGAKTVARPSTFYQCLMLRNSFWGNSATPEIPPIEKCFKNFQELFHWYFWSLLIIFDELTYNFKVFFGISRVLCEFLLLSILGIFTKHIFP